MSDGIELTAFSANKGPSSPPLDVDASMSSSITPSRSASSEPLNMDVLPPHWADKPGWKNRCRHFFKAWWHGPAMVSDLPPEPLRALAFVEDLPAKFRARTSHWKRVLILAVYLVLWIFLWSRLLLPYLSETPEVSGSGTRVFSLTCGNADQFWKGKNAACGPDADKCPSLDTLEDIIFRCPALCDRGSWLYSLRAVGDQIIKYRGFFIGGGGKKDKDALSYPYRADSFPCGAAVHAGVVSPFFGGCARVSYSSGAQAGFKSTKGRYGVSDSVEFGGFFPYLYYFKSIVSHVTLCYDPRLLVLLVNILLGIPVVFLGSGAAFFWIMATVGFWTISLATDPPILVEPQDPQSFYDLISLSLERFLPTCFVLFCLWTVSVKRTFGKLDDYTRLSTLEDDNEVSENFTVQPTHASYSSLARVLLWYPFFWLGILNNITFDRLPVDRLTWHDLQVQPGALMTVLVVGSILVCCIVAQAYFVWLSGRFWKLILVYGMMFASLVFFANLPGLSLRIHHYIFALMFIPGCSTRGKTAYAFQGILLGLFLSGVARWGFASIAETNLSLLRGEPLGEIYAPTFNAVNNGMLYWEEHPTKNLTIAQTEHLAKYTDVSLLINDVQRYTGPNDASLNLTHLFEENADLKSLLETSLKSGDAKDENGDITLFLRMAKYAPQDNGYGDYNRASILKYPSLNFTAGPPGIT